VTEVVHLVENGPPQDVPVDAATGAAVRATGLVDAVPTPDGRSWTLRPTSAVGAVRVGNLEVHVAPKVPIDRVVFLLQNSTAGVRWHDGDVDVAEEPDLLRAVVEVFERTTSRALRQGLLQGYRTVEEALPVVRGRVREEEQIRRRFGLFVPVEVRYDDFTPDTAENRLLRSALHVARRLPGLGVDLGRRLLRLESRFADVTLVASRHGLEPWRPTRLNTRLHTSLRLAEAILLGSSFEDLGSGLRVTGFVVSMAKVFEDFLTAALTPRLAAFGGTVTGQREQAFDVDGQVRIRPDLVWSDGSRDLSVVDAKYKAEKPSGFPNADYYQMLAYCSVLGLTRGHLVYARGNETLSSVVVEGSGVEIVTHVLDLSLAPTELMSAVDELAQQVGRTVSVTPLSPGL
jgi:5-methylcytosine-specific restriction enzyme subunit McrC